MSEFIECTKGNGSHSYRATDGRCGWCANLEALAAKEARLEKLEGALVWEDTNLWSFLRSVLLQGQDIALDYRDKGYELMSARVDAAAREREDELNKHRFPEVTAIDGKVES